MKKLNNFIKDKNFRTFDSLNLKSSYRKLKPLSLEGFIAYKWKNKIHKRPVVLCKCECGNNSMVRVEHLKSGSTSSCGCLQDESRSKNGKMNTLPKGEASFNSLYLKYKYRHRKKSDSKFMPKKKFRSLVSNNCHYCGSSPSNFYVKDSTANGGFIYIGLDRLDNSLGYEVNNIVPCCKICNRAKRELGYDIFLQWINQIKNFRIVNTPETSELGGSKS